MTTPSFVIRQAVTAVIQVEQEILLVRRHPALHSFAGYWAFPGGKVDKEDADAAGRASSWSIDQDPAVLQALARELKEEIDFDLDQAELDGNVCSLHRIGHALTPAIQPVRFDTIFYRLELGKKPDVTIDPGELAGFRWARPAELLREYEQGRLLLAPPTTRTIEMLLAGGGLEPSDVAIERDHEIRLPVLQPIKGFRMMPVRSHTLPPAIHTNCFLLGDEGQNRVAVDPSPWNDDEMEALAERLTDFGVNEIFLTHHHPDHCERADVLARKLGIGIASSLDTLERIRTRTPGFFDGIAHRPVGEGDVLTQWLGRDIQIIAVPGHDEGQLALISEDRAWCIVGDLIQGIGTVVIHKPEGHMGRYFRSLQRVIDLDPAVIIPSHGQAMGTTYRLQETLKHRRQREATVLELSQSGKSREEMFELIYPELNPVLKPLALNNIDSHLEKLREDGAIA